VGWPVERQSAQQIEVLTLSKKVGLAHRGCRYKGRVEPGLAMDQSPLKDCWAQTQGFAFCNQAKTLKTQGAPVKTQAPGCPGH
jgi:hypothetical protein